MKKLLLVNPPQPPEELTTEALVDLNPILPSLGLVYLAASARDAGYDVEIYDAYLYNHSLETARGRILEAGADLVGITCWTCNFHRVLKLADLLKASSPTPIVLGGPHVTMHREECIADPSVDYIVHGEGEITLVELLGALGRIEGGALREGELAPIQGIGYKTAGGRALVNPERPMIQDLDTLPFPAWDLMKIPDYRPAPQHYRTLPSVSMITSRGCPFSCTFCDAIAIWTRKYRVRSVDNVLAEIWHVYETYGVRDVNFWDDLWGVNKKWAIEFCQRLKKEGPPGITWTCECRVDTVNEQMLREMASAGCWCVFFGLESMEQECLDAINKNTNMPKIHAAVQWAKDAGIEVRTNFIVGLPNETPEKARRMLGEIVKLDLDYVKFTVLTPYPGTPLYADIKAGKYGVMNERMDRLSGHFATFVPYGYKSLDEVNEMARWLTRRYYLRPGYIWKRLRSLRSVEDVRKNWRGFVALMRG
jgi:anaerobic magnesium-protoporphyrin IX monomethyl ester cyclase